MASKKIKSLFTLSMLVSAFAFAQTENSKNGYMGGGYSVYDSSVIPTKRMGQQNEFWNNATAFPAKPRNMWEVGVSTGLFTVSGDVSNVPFTAPNFGIHVRKSLGYLFSLRLQYINTVGKGLNWKPSANFANNPAWIKNGYSGQFRNSSGTLTTITGNSINSNLVIGLPNDIVYYNYKTNVQDISLQGIFTINNIRFHKNKTGILLYGGGGIGGTLFQTKINALDANNRPYDAATGESFNSINARYQAASNAGTNLYKNRKAIRKDLNALLDDTYETDAENGNTNLPVSGKNTFKPSGTVLAGIAFKLSKRINLAIEDRWTVVKTDLLDGQQWQELTPGSPVQTRDFDSYNYVSVGLNFNLGGKSVEPLYWLNPLDYAYSELNTPKHMKLPKPVFNDGDGDGVIDEMDREPNTPAGCPVDTHGVTKDTDGDGVPDCKDKQLITPTECQPVDADGIGKCPDPKCCTDRAIVVDQPVVCPTDYPSLTFKGNACTLSSDTKQLLSTVATKMKSSPTCSVTMTGYSETSKASQAVCECRKNAIVKYMTETLGISADRLSFNCEVGDGGSNKNTVDIKSN